MKISHFFLAAVLILPGCIKVDGTLSLEKNGAGNLELIYALPEQTVTQMKSMFKLRDQLDSVMGQTVPKTLEDDFEQAFFDPSEDRIKQLVKKYEKSGITLDTLKVETRNAVRNVILKLMFSDLKQLSSADFFQKHGFSLFRNKNDTYTFTRSPDTGQTPSQAPLTEAESVGMLSPILGGFRVALKVNTPGRIIETNASRKTLYNAAWIFEFDKNPKALETLQKQSMKIVFDGKGSQRPEVRQVTGSSTGQAVQR